MILKKAVIFGALIWVLIFFEVSILMFGFNLPQWAVSYYAWHYSLSGIIVVIVSWFYFKKGKGDLEQGILTGLVFTITSIVLDALVTVPLFVKDYGFFLNRFLWISYLEGIVIAALVGAIRKRI